MKLKEKYPETQFFHWHNENLKNRVTEDCVFRAVARATGIPYNQVVMDMAENHCKYGYCSQGNRGIELIMKKYGWVKHSQPRKADNTKSYICNIDGHHTVAIVDKKVNDIWDSTDGCIGIYYTEG